MDRVPSRARASWLQRHPLVIAKPFAGFGISELGDVKVRHYSPQIPTKRLDGAGMIAMLLPAPSHPCLVKHLTLNAEVRVDDAPVSNEGTNWTGKIAQFLDSLRGRIRLDKMATPSQAVSSCNCPVQDGGQFLEQFACQQEVFVSVEGLHEPQ